MTKSILSLVLILTLLPLVGCGPAAIKVDPAEFVGTWHTADPEQKIEATLTLNADGTFAQDVDSHGPMENLLVGDMKFSGKWVVEDGYLVGEVTESTNETQMPIGRKMYDWIREFKSKDHYIVETQQGFLNEYTWVPEEPALELSVENTGPALTP